MEASTTVGSAFSFEERIPPPESFFVFVVGNCEEWPEERAEEGDEALYNEYIDLGVPPDQCMYIKNDDCTKTNCQEKLEMFLNRASASLLSRQNQDTTLVFYYGGHGIPRGLATIGGIWMFEQICKTIEKLFKGNRVLFLLDCCAAGNLCLYLPSVTTNTKQNTQYVLLATSAPYLTTSTDGDEWVLTNSWIQMMRWWGYYDGKSKSNSEQHQQLLPSLDDHIALLADRTAFAIQDQFFAYVTPSEGGNSNSRLIDLSWMPKRRQQRNLSSSSSSFSYTPYDKLEKWKEQIPEEGRINSISNCRVGDSVFYRHPGGVPNDSTIKKIIPPIWLIGIIISTDNDNSDQQDDGKNRSKSVRVRVNYPTQQEQWEVEVAYENLMNFVFIANQWMLSRFLSSAQIMLAQDFQQYLDYTSLVANTPVKVKFEGKIRDGIIIDWRDFDWKKHIAFYHPSSTDSSSSVFLTVTDYDDYDFHELPVPVRTAAINFGYTESSWDDESGNAQIPADSKEWNELTIVEQKAAKILGYVRQKQKNIKKQSSHFGLAGPVVPVKWNKTDHNDLQPCLVPLQLIDCSGIIKFGLNLTETSTMAPPISSNNHDRLKCDKELRRMHRQVLIRSLEVNGRSIGNATSIFGTSSLTAYWPQGGTFHDAVPIDEDDTTLELLASHFEFTPPGIYCPILYADGDEYMIPVSYIFKRGEHQNIFSNTVSQKSTNDDSNGEQKLSSTTNVPTKESIDMISNLLLRLSVQASSFGDNFVDVASQLEHTSYLLRAKKSLLSSSSNILQRTELIDDESTSTLNDTATSSVTCSKKSYINHAWIDLPEIVKISAQRIGYNDAVWDTKGYIPICNKEWKDLTQSEQKNLKVIGHNEDSWNKDSSSEDDDDADDSDYM